MVLRICNTCGKDFKTIPAIVRYGYAKFCSRKCFYKNGHITKKCLFCNEEFTRRKSQSFIKCCSRLCSSKSRKGKPLQRKTKKILIRKNCLKCNKEFEVVYKERKRKYCSVSCSSSSIWTKELRIKVGISRRGQGGNNWKGGVTPKDKLERIRFRNIMQKQIFERDLYTCQICGVKGGILQVDHIQSWKDYVELRFKMENCRTLCMDCHYQITYGRPKPKDVTWGQNLKYVIEGRVN